jgi:ribosomal protein L11 methyltransferase
MKFKRVTARFDAEDLNLAEELICDIFFSFNLKGVVCDVPIEEPDEGFGTHTLPKLEIFSITGYLPLLDSTDILLSSMKKKFSGLADLGITVTVTTEIVDEKDWADAWKSYFEVTRITDRIVIKPEWKDHTPGPDEIVIHLDPGMAFGTGTHPTTAMCIQLIEAYLEPGNTFLDVGTGSGILMIAASHLGAGKMIGIDTDEIAVTITRQNLDRNHIDDQAYTLACTTLDKIHSQPCDMIAANIIAQVIVQILPDISQRMTSRTTTILSGIIRDRLPDVRKALETQNLIVLNEAVTDEWVALAVRKKMGP